jgi:threonine/homoserine/homoserine lactone efflux protein
LLILAFFIGLIIAIPVGPLGQIIINRSIKRGFWHGFSLAIFDALVNFIFCVVFLYGISTLEMQPVVKLALNIFGLIVLFFVAVKEFFFTSRTSNKNISIETTTSLRTKDIFGNILLTLVYYITNPTIIAFWINFSSIVHDKIIMQSTLSNILVFSLLFSLGVLTSQYLGIIFMKYIQRIHKFKKAVKYASASLFVLTFGYFFFTVIQSIREIQINSF